MYVPKPMEILLKAAKKKKQRHKFTIIQNKNRTNIVEQ